MIAVVDTNPNQVRVSGRGAFIDSEHVWRMPVDENDLWKLESEFAMKPINYESVPQAFWRAFPGWWRPKAGTDMTYLSTPNFPAGRRGPDGYHFLAAYNPATQQLYVWHKFNF